MNEPVLSLPAPAAELWGKVRGAVREELARITDREPLYAIGGGSVLSARWGHRESYDVDLVVDPKTALGMLSRENNPASAFESKMQGLGGTSGFTKELGLWRVSFDGGERNLDLWATTPRLNAGEHPATVDGLMETVLSSAQILRGKLERSAEHLPRDVFDIVKASEKEPRALEAAVNAISQEMAHRIAQNFHWAGPTIAVEAEDALGGVPPSEHVENRELGNLAAQAVSNALYTMCRIETRDGAIEVNTKTRSRPKNTARISVEDAEGHFEAHGLTAYLRDKGPGADALLDYARTACARGRNRVVFEADADGVTAWRTAKAGMNLTPGNAADALDKLEGRREAPAQRSGSRGHDG